VGVVTTAGSTLPFLAGKWNVVRHISDARTGQRGTFIGTAVIEPAADDPGGGSLSYEEQGELRFGGHCGPARRSLIYRERDDGAADVLFADGRDFYRLDLRSGTWRAEHPCREDRYTVTVTVLNDISSTETWRVRGPAKEYEMTTHYVRAGLDE